MKSELEQQNQAGFTKLPEQVELKESEAFEAGYQSAVEDALHGRLAKDGIHNREQVKEFIGIYGTAIKQSIHEIKGVYRLGSGADDEDRLYHRIIQEANAKFGRILDTDSQAESEI
jgi:hypothetical protein